VCCFTVAISLSPFQPYWIVRSFQGRPWFFLSGAATEVPSRSFYPCIGSLFPLPKRKDAFLNGDPAMDLHDVPGRSPSLRRPASVASSPLPSTCSWQPRGPVFRKRQNTPLFLAGASRFLPVFPLAYFEPLLPFASKRSIFRMIFSLSGGALLFFKGRRIFFRPLLSLYGTVSAGSEFPFFLLITGSLRSFVLSCTQDNGLGEVPADADLSPSTDHLTFSFWGWFFLWPPLLKIRLSY